MSRLGIRDQLAKVMGSEDWPEEYMEEHIALMPACEEAVIQGLTKGGIGAGTLTKEIINELGVFKECKSTRRRSSCQTSASKTPTSTQKYACHDS